MTYCMPPINIKLSILYIAVLSMLGCTRYEYVSPTTSAGNECVFEARMAKLQCEERADSEFSACDELQMAKAEQRFKEHQVLIERDEQRYQACEASKEAAFAAYRQGTGPYPDIACLREVGDRSVYDFKDNFACSNNTKKRCQEEFDIVFQACGGTKRKL